MALPGGCPRGSCEEMTSLVSVLTTTSSPPGTLAWWCFQERESQRQYSRAIPSLDGFPPSRVSQTHPRFAASVKVKNRVRNFAVSKLTTRLPNHPRPLTAMTPVEETPPFPLPVGRSHVSARPRVSRGIPRLRSDRVPQRRQSPTPVRGHGRRARRPKSTHRLPPPGPVEQLILPLVFRQGYPKRTAYRLQLNSCRNYIVVGDSKKVVFVPGRSNVGVRIRLIGRCYRFRKLAGGAFSFSW